MRSGLIIVVAVFLAHPQVTLAQRAWDLAGGYTYLQDPPDRTNFPAGWMAGVDVAVTDWLSAVVDVSRHWESTLDIDLSASAMTGGLRASARVGRLTEFAQLLAGVAHSSSTVVGVTSSQNNLTIQPGGGVEYPSGRRVAARFEFDYRGIAGGIGPPIADPRHQFRFVWALVYRHPAKSSRAARTPETVTDQSGRRREAAD
jgi:hypothetical protein